MALRERERELDHGVADRESCDPVLAGDVRRVEPAEDDVGAAEMWIERVRLRRHDGSVPWPQRLDRLGVGFGHALDRAEELEMLRTDVGHDDEGRLRDRAELCDLAEPAHAHLGDQHLRLGLEPAHRERQADLVVQAPLGPDRGTCGEQSAPRMSFVVVFPADPTTATTCASLFSRTSARKRRECALPGRRGRASHRAPCARLVDVPTPVFERDEEVPRPTSRESASTPVIESPGSPPSSTPRASRAISSSRTGITSCLARSIARDLAVVERGHDAFDVLALLVSLARDHDDVTRSGERERAGYRARADQGRSRRPCPRPAGLPG